MKCGMQLVGTKGLSYETRNSCPMCRTPIVPEGSKEHIERLQRWLKRNRSCSNNDGTNVKCTDVQVFAEDEGKQLICTVPSGTGIRRPMRITVNALRGMSTFTYSRVHLNL